MKFWDDLHWRGLIKDSTANVEALLETERITGYIGFDPTAASLHVGSLLPLITLARFQQAGHRPICIAGGGTGMVGDPSGKSSERPILTREEIKANLKGIRKQLAQFLDFKSPTNGAMIIDNADWLASIKLMDFLRDVGKYITVNSMLSKESVARRIDSTDGISYTEFTYMLLQAYDYLVLFDKHDCRLQMGGSDQWGNILAGSELIRKLRGSEAHGITFPLLQTSAGTKFGKTEAGTVWLDPKLTSPYKFYQFWFNTDDRDVISYLKMFTFISREEIKSLVVALGNEPGKRESQRRLADEMTKVVHGKAQLHRAQRCSQALFGNRISGLKKDELLDVFNDAPSSEISRQCADEGIRIDSLITEIRMLPSKREAKRAIMDGGIYVGERRVQLFDEVIKTDDFIEDELLVLRRGSKNYHLVKLV